MQVEKKKFFIAVSVLVGTCIGAGVLGIPYVAAQAGFFVALIYIILIGLMLLLVNLYLGEISLRTKGNHQLVGYAERYLGKRGKYLMQFAIVFGVYAAIIAYMLGIGQSFSYLFFGNSAHTILLSVLFSVIMSLLLWRGIKALKKFEKVGVLIILGLLTIIFFIFIGKVNPSYLFNFDVSKIFLPFGVILFALMSFHAVPEVEIILHRNEKLAKKVFITGMLISIIFYILFALVVVGFKGPGTPEIATLSLGPLFIFLGIFTMFTSWLSLGNALDTSFKSDNKIKKRTSWLFVAIVPVLLFLFVELFSFFSFTRILSIGGVVSGGLTAILVLLMLKKAKQKGNRKPEYSIPVNWFVIGFLILIFVLGVVREFLVSR